MWKFRGQQRPDFAQVPGANQESVWDYPRPPALRPCDRHVRVAAGEEALADTTASIRVLETASPPTFYLPPSDVVAERLVVVPGSSFCEWKGSAEYLALASDRRGRPVAWRYPEPSARFRPIAGYLSFYPALVDCFVDDEKVRPQPGGFYGGWITDDVVGPFKGDPATGHW